MPELYPEKEFLIGFSYSFMEIRMLHKTVVDKKELFPVSPS
jgi:hypothetical protein